MPTITLSDDMHTRLTAFKSVVETVIEKEIGFEQHVEAVLHLG